MDCAAALCAAEREEDMWGEVRWDGQRCLHLTSCYCTRNAYGIYFETIILCGHQMSEFSREVLGSLASLVSRFCIFLDFPSFLEESLRVLCTTVVENSFWVFLGVCISPCSRCKTESLGWLFAEPDKKSSFPETTKLFFLVNWTPSVKLSIAKFEDLVTFCLENL